VVSLGVALVAIIPYLVVLGVAGSRLELLPGPKRAKRWIISAVNEEELELEVAIRPTRGRPIDALVALGRSWSWWRPASPWSGEPQPWATTSMWRMS